MRSDPAECKRFFTSHSIKRSFPLNFRKKSSSSFILFLFHFWFSAVFQLIKGCPNFQLKNRIVALAAVLRRNGWRNPSPLLSSCISVLKKHCSGSETNVIKLVMLFDHVAMPDDNNLFR